MSGSDILAAIGLIAVIEGLVLSLAPHASKRALMQMASLPPDLLRQLGLTVLGLGGILAWIALAL